MTRRNRSLVFLLASILAATVGLLVVQAAAARVLAGALLFLFLPGYLFLRLLWPPPNRPSDVWVLGLILPVSMALVGVLLLVMHYSAVYDYRAVVVCIGILDSAFAVVGHLQNGAGWHRTHRTWRLLPAPCSLARLAQPYWSNWLLAAAGLAFLLAIVYAGWTPKRNVPPTEFYILSSEGKVPFSVTAHQARFPIIVGVHNHEGRAVEYQVVARSTGDYGMEELGAKSIYLLDEEATEITMTLELPPGRTSALAVDLFLAGNRTIPHRSATLLVDQERGALPPRGHSHPARPGTTGPVSPVGWHESCRLSVPKALPACNRRG